MRTIETTIIEPEPFGLVATFLFTPMKGAAIDTTRAILSDPIPEVSSFNLFEVPVTTGFGDLALLTIGALAAPNARPFARSTFPELPPPGQGIAEIPSHNLDGVTQHLINRGNDIVSASRTGLLDNLLKYEIIVETSPPALIDFISVLKTGSGVAIGALTGYAAADLNPPLLLVTVPAGIIFCAAAMEVGRGIEGVLRYRVRRWLAGKNEEPGEKEHNS
jgi:hypothetical protein